MTAPMPRATADLLRDSQPRWVVRPGSPSEIPAVAELVTAAMTLGRQPLALTQLSETLRRSGPGDVWLSVVQAAPVKGDGREGRDSESGGATLVAAAIATRSSPSSAQLVGVGHLGELGDRLGADLLQGAAAGLHTQLAAQGIRYIQANWEADDPRPPFAPCGYRRLARLEYLLGEVPVLLGHARARREADQLPPMRGEPLDPAAGPDNRSRWVQLAERTFQGTQDCPLLSELRSPEDVIASYMAAPGYDPTAWQIFQLDGQDVACLILAPHPGGEVLELAYMGIVPAQRGRRWGSRLMGEAVRVASEQGAGQLMLAVDRQNAPAIRLYRAWGLARVASEAAWGRGLANSPVG